MKRLTAVITFLICFNCCLSQSIKIKYPFDLDILKEFSADITANDTILPIYRDGHYYYINSYTGKDISTKWFDEAYLFRDKYAIVKKDGKYGIINKDVSYKLPPAFDKPEVFLKGAIKWVADGRSITRFSYQDGSLSTNEYVNRPEGEPLGPQIGFRKEGNKFFFELQKLDKDDKHIRSAAIYDAAYVFNLYFALAKKDGKIGIVNDKGETVFPFIYDDLSAPRSDWWLYWHNNLFALRQGKKWHYFKFERDDFEDEGHIEELFQNNFKPDMSYPEMFMFRVGKLYNYFNNKGVKMLPRSYKWIDQSGNLAVNTSDEVVLFNNKKQEFIYYKP